MRLYLPETGGSSVCESHGESADMRHALRERTTRADASVQPISRYFTVPHENHKVHLHAKAVGASKASWSHSAADEMSQDKRVAE